MSAEFVSTQQYEVLKDKIEAVNRLRKDLEAQLQATKRYHPRKPEFIEQRDRDIADLTAELAALPPAVEVVLVSKLRAEVLEALDTEIAETEEGIAELLAKVAENPTYYLEWRLEDIIKMDRFRQHYRILREHLSDRPVQQWRAFLDAVRDQLRDRLVAWVGYGGAHSTSPAANVVETFTKQAEAEIVDPHRMFTSIWYKLYPLISEHPFYIVLDEPQPTKDDAEA